MGLAREPQNSVLAPAQSKVGHRTSVFKHDGRWMILAVTFALTPGKLGPSLNYAAVAAAAAPRPGKHTTLAETAAAVRAIRAEKGMILDPCDHDGRTAGSVFLSPDHCRYSQAPEGIRSTRERLPDGFTRVSASWLIRAAGFRLGRQLITPGVRISVHFTLVTDDGATASSFAVAAATVARRVRQVTGVTLTAEPDAGELPGYASLTGQQNHAPFEIPSRRMAASRRASAGKNIAD